MSSGSIRIIQLPEKSSVNTDDYMAVDSSANGTKKVKFTDLLDDNLSVSNKAADAQATGEAINNISARVDNMINTQTNAEVTTLWTGRINLKNETANLSESINNFDFIDVYCGSSDTIFARTPVSSYTHFELQAQNMSDDASVQFMRWWETGLTISGTTATINKAIKCFWDDFSTAPIVSQATGGGIDIVRIDGVKTGHVENDEIVDARVGANDVTYPTLGDAIRGQVTDLESKLNDLGFEEIQTEGDLITAQGLTLTSTMSAMWATNGTIVENSAYQYYQAINQPIKVEAGKTYKFYGIYDANTNGAVILLDANMQNGLRKWGVVSADGGEYTIPDGYSYLCLDVYRAKTLSDIKIIGDVGTGKYVSDNVVLEEDSVEVPMTNFAEYVDDPNWVDTTNMLDDVTWSASGYMRHINGQLVTSQYTTQYIASDFIPVVAGYKYRATTGDAQGNQLYAVFFSDLKNDGVSQNLGWLNGGEYVDFTVPDGKTYVSFNCVYNGTNKINGLYRRTQLENEKGISIPRLVVGSDSGKPFSGKTIVNFGDSIFGQARPPVDVSTFLAEYTGATVYNAGFGGCQMGYHGTANYDAFSMYRLADAIASGDWSAQETAASASGMPSYFADTVTMLEGIDFSDVDIITISYGTNDFENGNALGGNAFSSVDKALDYSISTILTAYPNIRIFVCLPMYRVWLSGGAYSYDSNTATHTSWVDGVTRTFKDFVEAERSVAEANQTPIIDTYYDLGINKYNWTQYFPANDGTHHNLTGRKLIAELMSHKLW